MIHLLTQFAWPDAAPTGLLAEQLADRLTAEGHEVVIVAGAGQYRLSQRAQPYTPIVRLEHRLGRRGSLVSSAVEFFAVNAAFRRYIAQEVRNGDTVIVTSAPPNTVSLAVRIRARGARAVYWLQDYYPELLRTLWDYPAPVRRQFRQRWDRALGKWDTVVKAAANLGYHGNNAVVIRNWATLDLGEPEPAEPGTALYSGNLGYCHHLPSFIALCEELRREGYQVTVRGDGVGRRKLPDWIDLQPALADSDELRRSYWQAELHLVAAHPAIREAVFPSKFWNSHATGRQIRAAGFVGEMLDELEKVQRGDLACSLDLWSALFNPRFADDLLSRPTGSPPDNAGGWPAAHLRWGARAPSPAVSGASPETLSVIESVGGPRVAKKGQSKTVARAASLPSKTTAAGLSR